MHANEVIELLNLKPLPEEGGFYAERYRDPGQIPASALPLHSGNRNYSTQIYYLVTPEEFSGLHAVKSAEAFHFYLGDPVEIAGLTQAFGLHTDKKGFCAVGSVKTNIGHLDTASGIASLIKTVLALQNKELPPSLHYEVPNSEIDFADSPS